MLHKRILATFAAIVLVFSMCAIPTFAAGTTTTYTVVSGDTMWKVAVKYKVGVSEIIAANPQFSNPNMIYPGNILNIPLADSSVTAYESQVITLVNQARASNGLAPLTANWELSRIARYKSQDMADKGYFSHTSPTYGTPFEMIRAFGLSYHTAGENIARGYSSPESVMKGWMNSTGHRENILGNYTQIGVGYVSNGNYWTMELIS